MQKDYSLEERKYRHYLDSKYNNLEYDYKSELAITYQRFKEKIEQDFKNNRLNASAHSEAIDRLNELRKKYLKMCEVSKGVLPILYNLQAMNNALYRSLVDFFVHFLANSLELEFMSQATLLFKKSHLANF